MVADRDVDAVGEIAVDEELVGLGRECTPTSETSEPSWYENSTGVRGGPSAEGWNGSMSSPTVIGTKRCTMPLASCTPGIVASWSRTDAGMRARAPFSSYVFDSTTASMSPSSTLGASRRRSFGAL